ncbi:hypothetical protein TD95_004615 [Thielaviopsis punctulata]|uniref:Peroxin/Ferlin domain-containing protein n=1 Tax=Thielaviopsis punctulata TaxID=72032 RepID=A0A0F4ZJE9_9PEZI|nr:hypothetical protein TD95_004615 [Thielaviopsis punctulata]
MSSAKTRPDSLEALATGTGAATGAVPPTYAAFSSASLSTSTVKAPLSRSTAKRSTILVHQKSPLLLATPPQITRALAYSHPFLLPLNRLAGLLTWTSGDPWESFLLLAAFWAIVLYGDVILRLAGPIVVVLGLIVGMYSRRFSPLSSSGWGEPGRPDTTKDGSSVGSSVSNTGSKATAKSSSGAGDAAAHARAPCEATNTRHQKTLDEIVETLKEFTARCNMLLEPMLSLTDFLSTQRTPTSATVRPALTTLFIRILFCTPFWFALTLPPLRIITTRRIVMVFGSLVLTWHSRPMRVCRAVLWRSSTVRRSASLITGLDFHVPLRPGMGGRPGSFTASGARASKSAQSELTRQLKGQSLYESLLGRNRTKDAGVKFTFIIYENQRRWLGLGWTANLFGYERAAWTDEHNNEVPARDQFELPDVEEDSNMQWRWVAGSKWKVDGVFPADDGSEEVDYDGEAGKMGWVYYDNKWQNGKRGEDGWTRWTRRRKWYRDAELVDTETPNLSAASTAKPSPIQKRPSPLSQRPSSSSSSGRFKPTMQGYSTIDEKMISPLAPEPATSSSSCSHSTSPSSIMLNQRPPSQDTDSASLLSTSSRSFFKPSTLKRRAEQRQSRGLATAAAGVSGETGNDARSETGSLLGVQTELEIQGHNKESHAWGIGDEANMALD